MISPRTSVEIAHALGSFLEAQGNVLQISIYESDRFSLEKGEARYTDDGKIVRGVKWSFRLHMDTVRAAAAFLGTNVVENVFVLKASFIKRLPSGQPLFKIQGVRTGVYQIQSTLEYVIKIDSGSILRSATELGVQRKLNKLVMTH